MSTVEMRSTLTEQSTQHTPAHTYFVSRYKHCPLGPANTNFHIEPVSKSSVSLSDNTHVNQYLGHHHNPRHLINMSQLGFD